MRKYKEAFSKEFIEKIQQTEKETGMLYLSNDGELPLTQSKVGGVGYFPKEETYPIGASGKPLSLLAQLNFSELPEMKGYPTEGLLAFYIDEHDDLIGLDLDKPKNQAGYRVYYFENLAKANFSREELASFPTPEYKIVNGEYAVACIKKQMPVLGESYEFEQAYGQDFYDFFEGLYGDDVDEKIDEVFDLLTEELGDAHVGGYPSFTQTDPRFYHENLQADVLLFQLDSVQSEDVEVMWGDFGIGNFFIHPEDLKNKHFHKAWYNWDCH